MKTGKIFRSGALVRGIAIMTASVVFCAGAATAGATPQPGSESTVTVINGENSMTTATRNAMSSRSSSIQQSDGSRDDLREVRIASNDWSVSVLAVDHLAADADRSSHRLAIDVDDRFGRHPVRPGRTYVTADGTQFTADGEGVHIVQPEPNGLRAITDVVRISAGGRSSRLGVTRHSCQADHC